MNEREDIEIRSQEIQEIMGTPPNWLLRWGSLMALIVVVLLAWVGFFVEYPETVEGDIKVTTANPPKRLVAERQGRVKKVMAENESIVEEGQVLIVFDNDASFADVMTLHGTLTTLPAMNDSTLAYCQLPDGLMLGSLREPLYEFYRKQEAVRYKIENPYDRYSVSRLNSEYRKVQSIIRNDRDRWDKIDRQIDLVNDRLARDQQLYDEQLLSEERLERTRENLLSLRRTKQGIESGIKIRELELSRIRAEKDGVKAGSQDELAAESLELRESFTFLKKASVAWLKRYVVLSPIQGRVSFNTDAVNAQQFVEESQELGTVVPILESQRTGQLELEMSKAVRVQPGQRVIVRFDGYPYLEFGAVLGAVSSKAQVPIDNKIAVQIALPDTLITTFDRIITPTRGMKGNATIVLQNKRFLERVFEGVRGGFGVGANGNSPLPQ